jgi:hypothetical protein
VNTAPNRSAARDDLAAVDALDPTCPNRIAEVTDRSA